MSNRGKSGKPSAAAAAALNMIIWCCKVTVGLSFNTVRCETFEGTDSIIYRTKNFLLARKLSQKTVDWGIGISYICVG
jgi:hypothetical protein